MTVSVPVFQYNDFIGMVAMDTPIKEFFDQPELLKPNQYTYAFMVDNKGEIAIEINRFTVHCKK